MKTRNLKTKTLSILLAVVMLFGMLPMSVFAAEPTTEVPTCYCVEKCTEDSANESCDICAADYTACTGEDSAAAYSSEYAPDDVAAIQAIINASPTLKAQYNVDDPGTWADKGLVKWEDEGTLKRAKVLSLQYTVDSGEEINITDFSGTLDASALTALTELNCPGNEGLTELILPQAGNLTHLKCYETGITALDISGHLGLEFLECYDTGISVLDVSNYTALFFLDCEWTNVSSLELSKLSNLETLWCNGTNITSLDVTGNPELVHLNCSNTGITALDLSKNTKLLELYCENTQITALDLSANPLLTAIHWPASMTQPVTPEGYCITMTQTPGGTIELFRQEDENGNLYYGLTAYENPGYVFARWNGVANIISGDENTRDMTFDVNGDMEISAVFGVEERLRLSSLVLEGAALTPALSKDIFSYTASVPYDVTSINIVAQGHEGYEHQVTGTGRQELAVGENTFIVTVTVPLIQGDSSAGTLTQDYVITVTRQAKEDSPADDEPKNPSNPQTPTSPQTGDNSNLALWIALLFISGGAVVTLTVVDRKRKAVKR